LVEKYKSVEKKKPVKIKNEAIFKKKKYKVIEANLLHESEFIRHSDDKVKKVITEIITKNELEKNSK
jgi:hypothetical protein